MVEKMKPSREELLGVLQEAYVHLVEHNIEYHHITPSDLLDRIRKLLGNDQQEKEKS